MNDTLDARAEILKLARLLRRDPAELAYLERVPAADIRVLREQITDALFDAGSAALSRLAAASRVLPAPIIATIAQRTFGPVLSARITGMLDPGRAVEVAQRLSTEFLADIALELDPRRTRPVLSRIPPRQIAAITRELVRRGEYVMMGRFVGYLSDDAVLAAVGVMDDITLLRSAFVLETKDTLDHLLDLVGDERLDAVIEAAAYENLWVEVLGLLSSLDQQRRSKLAQRAAVHDDEVLETIVRVAGEQDLWLALLPLASVLPHRALQRVAREVARMDDGRREAIIRDAREAGFDDELSLLERFLDSHPG